MDEIKEMGKLIQKSKQDKATAEGRLQTYMEDLKRLGLNSPEEAEKELQQLQKRMEVIQKKRNSKLQILRENLQGLQ